MKRKSPEVTDTRLSVIRDGLRQEFWSILKGILQDEKRSINADVMNKQELGLTDKQVDDLIRWHKFLDYVVELPEKIIEASTKSPEGAVKNYDPYHTIETVRQTIKSDAS